MALSCLHAKDGGCGLWVDSPVSGRIHMGIDRYDRRPPCWTPHLSTGRVGVGHALPPSTRPLALKWASGPASPASDLETWTVRCGCLCACICTATLRQAEPCAFRAVHACLLPSFKAMTDVKALWKIRRCNGWCGLNCCVPQTAHCALQDRVHVLKQCPFLWHSIALIRRLWGVQGSDNLWDEPSGCAPIFHASITVIHVCLMWMAAFASWSVPSGDK